MLIVAGGGLGVNILMYFVLHGGSSHSHGLMSEGCSHEHGEEGHDHGAHEGCDHGHGNNTNELSKKKEVKEKHLLRSTESDQSNKNGY